MCKKAIREQPFVIRRGYGHGSKEDTKMIGKSRLAVGAPFEGEFEISGGGGLPAVLILEFAGAISVTPRDRWRFLTFSSMEITLHGLPSTLQAASQCKATASSPAAISLNAYTYDARRPTTSGFTDTESGSTTYCLRHAVNRLESLATGRRPSAEARSGSVSLSIVHKKERLARATNFDWRIAA